MKANTTRDILLLLLLALALRLLYLMALPRVLDTADAIHYIGVAKHFAAGTLQEADPNIPLLYPLLTACAASFLPDYESAGSAVSFAASLLLVIPVYLLSRRMHGPAAARMAGVAIALWPWLADYGLRVGPDALAATLWFIGIYLLAQGLQLGGWRIVAAALCLFALHLARAEGTVIMIAAIPAAVVLCWNRRRNLLRLIPYVGVIILLLALNVLYLKSMTGTATANYRAHMILRDLDLVQYAATGLKTFCETLPIMLGPVLLLFLGVGLFWGARQISGRDYRLEAYVFVFAAVQFVSSLFVLSPEPRYVMSVLIALSLWSARGIVIVGEEASKVRWGKWLRYAPAASLVCLMLLGTATAVAAQHLDRRSSDPSEYKVAGKWMKENLSPGLVFTRKPQVGYYAEMPTTGPDFTDTIEEAVIRAKNAGARYFVVDERYTTAMVPALKTLLEPASAPESLRFIKDFPQYPHSRIVIYELVVSR